MQSWKGKSKDEGTKVSKRSKDGRGYGPKENPAHLYLVLDDWSSGFSIRKIDLSFADPCRQLTPGDKQRVVVCTGMHRLPSALLRFHGVRGAPRSIIGAFDKLILAIPPYDRWFPKSELWIKGGTVIDIHARTFLSGPWKKRASPDVDNPICIPVSGMLFLLGTSFQMLYISRSKWVWLKLPTPIFQYRSITSYAVHPDGKTIFVSAHAAPSAVTEVLVTTPDAALAVVEPDDAAEVVEPEDRAAVKVSRVAVVEPEDVHATSAGLSGVPTTFSIGTPDPAILIGSKKEICKWKNHGPWQLPFTGRGYFDPELDAWVGLSSQPNTIGHICSCDVVSTDSDISHRYCPALKVSKEKLFSKIPAERHIGASLVYMGGSKFCLLEGIYIDAGLADQPTEYDEMNEHVVYEFNQTDSDETDEIDSTDSDGTNWYSIFEEVNEAQDRKRFLRLTTFSLKYDKNGDLTTGNSCRVCYYSVPQQATDSILSYPVAFWM